MLRPTQKAQLRLAAKRHQQPPGLPGYPGRLGEMGHLRRLGGRWSALGGAWPDPKGPGRCLPTPWVPWVHAVALVAERALMGAMIGHLGASACVTLGRDLPTYGVSYDHPSARTGVGAPYTPHGSY